MITRRLLRLTQLLILISCAVATAPAQTGRTTDNDARPSSPATPSTTAAAAQADNRTSADETFDLNITERRITERDFEASTSVEAGEESARGLSLKIGVAVRAGEINVLLRNVRGRVRFRGNLERVLERLNLRRTPDAVP